MSEIERCFLVLMFEFELIISTHVIRINTLFNNTNSNLLNQQQSGNSNNLVLQLIWYHRIRMQHLSVIVYTDPNWDILIY